MTQIIFKYNLETGYDFLILPADYKILTTQIQNGAIKVWVQHGNKIPPIQRVRFLTIGTGNAEEKLNDFKYINTVQQHKLVWHIFYKNESTLDEKAINLHRGAVN